MQAACSSSPALGASVEIERRRQPGPFVSFSHRAGRRTGDNGPSYAQAGGTGGPINLGQDLTRTNIFGTVWLNAKLMKIVGEVGRVSGGSIVTYNQFEGVQPADARTYYSVGLSFGR